MGRRSQVQLALMVVGLVVWAYGQRADDSRLTLVGVAFFAGAFVLRFFRKSAAPDE